MLIYSIFIAFLGSFLFGYTTCVIAGALIFLNKEFQFSDIQEGFLVSIILFGAMLGSYFSGKLSDKTGRRRALIYTGLIYIIGILLSVFNRLEVLFIGRMITGIGVGLSSVIIPVYLAEISPFRHRGAIGSMAMLGIAIGLFSAYIVNYLFSDSGNWQWMFGLALVPAFIFFCGMFFALDTSMKKSESHEESNLSLLNPKYKTLVILGIFISLSQQITGINVVYYYAPTIFENVGFNSPESATFVTLGIGFVTLVAALISTWLVDSWGRRPLFLLSLAGMIVSLSIFSISSIIVSKYMSTIALTTLPSYVLFFTVGLGSVMWVYLSEIYPRSIRGKAVSIAILINWIGNYFISLVFPLLADIWGIGGVFGFFAIISVIVFVLIAKFLPETKGQELV